MTNCSRFFIKRANLYQGYYGEVVGVVSLGRCLDRQSGFPAGAWSISALQSGRGTLAIATTPEAKRTSWLKLRSQLD